MTVLRAIQGQLQATCALCVIGVTTCVGSIPILLLGLLKLLPIERLKSFCTRRVDKVATLWSDVNNLYLKYIHPARWEVTGTAHFNPDEWHLVVANHQSWLDIVVLQRLFNRKIPVLKFFIKDQLKWVPLLGFSWWAMGCPFMKRYSKAYLEKYPHKKGNDLEATRKALDSFKQIPATLMSFIEGTRYTTQKKVEQHSPYTHLLKPKAGGVGFVIDAMGDKINQLLDVTILYPTHRHSLWDFLCCRVPSIKVHIRTLPIPAKFLKTPLLQSEGILSEFREWLNYQWSEKDALMDQM